MIAMTHVPLEGSARQKVLLTHVDEDVRPEVWKEEKWWLWMEKEVVAALIESVGTLFGALVVGIAGGLISRGYARERDRQDKESQWRQHAIELTKLDLERKLKGHRPGVDPPLRPLVLDFLANYRDLQQLGDLSPKDLYLSIERDRISSRLEPPDRNEGESGAA
jgi:hypothetical protein